jgi:hypothetical protein
MILFTLPNGDVEIRDKSGKIVVLIVTIWFVKWLLYDYANRIRW